MERAEKNFRRRKCNCSSLSLSSVKSSNRRRASARASLDQEIRQASGAPGVAGELPRVERMPCALDQRVCKRCGRETVVIGYEESSQLDVEPAKYFVLVTKREKRACRSCEDLGVFSAPLPPRIIEKCLASDRIVIETVVGKYCNHTPLHRQSMILERDLGLEVSRATLDGWVLQSRRIADPDGRSDEARVDHRNLQSSG